MTVVTICSVGLSEKAKYRFLDLKWRMVMKKAPDGANNISMLYVLLRML